MGQKISIPPVGLLRAREPRVLPHRPQPTPVHRRLDTPGERKLAGKAELDGWVPASQIVGCSHVVHGAIVPDTEAHSGCKSLQVLDTTASRAKTQLTY